MEINKNLGINTLLQSSSWMTIVIETVVGFLNTVREITTSDLEAKLRLLRILNAEVASKWYECQKCYGQLL